MIIWLLVVGDIFFQIIFRQINRGTQNSGFSFGFGENVFPSSFYIFLSLGLMSYLYIRHIHERGWWLVAGGGFANGLVRLYYGSVWDYLHWNLLYSLWFNLADVYIVIGTLWLLLAPLIKRLHA